MELGKSRLCVQPALLVGSFGRASTEGLLTDGFPVLRDQLGCPGGNANVVLLGPSDRSTGAAHHPVDEAIP